MLDVRRERLLELLPVVLGLLLGEEQAHIIDVRCELLRRTLSGEGAKKMSGCACRVCALQVLWRREER
jgi:hypothetical protein